jgi:hypothetical protein
MNALMLRLACPEPVSCETFTQHALFSLGRY